MNKEEFLEYIAKNFTISGEARRLVESILDYVAVQGMSEEEQHYTLYMLLDGAIGLEQSEINSIKL